MAASVDTLDGFLREMKARFPDATAKATLPDFWRKVTEQGVFTRYTDFSKGVIDTGNLIFFIAATAVFLFVTVKVLESRRWK